MENVHLKFDSSFQYTLFFYNNEKNYINRLIQESYTFEKPNVNGITSRQLIIKLNKNVLIGFILVSNMLDNFYRLINYLYETNINKHTDCIDKNLDKDYNNFKSTPKLNFDIEIV